MQFYSMKVVMIIYIAISSSAKTKIFFLIVENCWIPISMSTMIWTIGDMQNVWPSSILMCQYPDFEFHVEFGTVVIKCLRNFSFSNANFAGIFVDWSLAWFASRYFGTLQEIFWTKIVQSRLFELFTLNDEDYGKDKSFFETHHCKTAQMLKLITLLYRIWTMKASTTFHYKSLIAIQCSWLKSFWDLWKTFISLDVVTFKYL